VTASAPRIDPRLLAAIGDLDRRDRPIAETNRRVGLVASQLGLPKPSYEQVRTVVHASRNGRRYYGLVDAYIDLTFRTAHAQQIVERLLQRELLPDRK
jgi:hypothetical protein